MMPQPNTWVPVGPDSGITMDSVAPYVGVHSPVVHKHPEVVIRQASFDPKATTIRAAPTSIVLYEFAT